MISTLLMISVAAILALTLAIARQSDRRRARLEREHHAMRAELDQHRQTLQSILRELENP